MRTPTRENIALFIEELGRRFPYPADIYIFGGSALMLIGSPRVTMDIDYTVKVDANQIDLLRRTIVQQAKEMDLDMEESIPSEFMPLPPDAEQRRQILFRFGQISAYLFDPYSIALSKLERGFRSDLEDVLFLVRNGFIELTLLSTYLNVVVDRSDDPVQLRASFDEILQRL